MNQIVELANLYDAGIKGYNRMNGQIISTDGISGTIRANSGGHNEVKILEPCFGAIRGRNPDNPSDRTAGAPTQQRLEINQSGVSNTLTTVQKDNVVVYDLYNHNEIKNGVCGTLTANGNTSTTHCGTFGIQNGSSIRKLTPLECWRLMGFDDADHERAENAGVSNSQRYKQAGNSIVVNVLEAIFKQMI